MKVLICERAEQIKALLYTGKNVDQVLYFCGNQAQAVTTGVHVKSDGIAIKLNPGDYILCCHYYNTTDNIKKFYVCDPISFRKKYIVKTKLIEGVSNE